MNGTDSQNMAQSMRRDLLAQSRQYFEKVYSPEQEKFIAGETYIPPTAKRLDAEDLEHLIDASLDLWLTAGRYSTQFEAELPKFFDRKVKALLVNSGSSANLLAFSSLFSHLLKQMGRRPLEKGDEVISVAAGFPTTVNPTIQNGCVPVFIDVDLATLNALPEAIEAAITPKTRAVMLAHTLGNPYRADKVAEICKKHDLYLVEDCCDALGARIDGKSVGSFGEYATLSFYPAHHVTMGEGGAVLSKTVQYRRIAESVRDWGRDCYCEPGKDNTCGKRYGWKLGDLPEGYDHKYTYSHIGYNLKVTDMQAAIGVSQLKKANGFIQARRKNYATLTAGIASSPILRETLRPVVATPGTEPSWFGLPLHCMSGIKRDALVRQLEEHKVGTRLVFGGNLLKQPAYIGQNYRVHGELKNTDSVMTDTFWIAVHPRLTDAHTNYMLETLEKVIKTLK